MQTTDRIIRLTPVRTWDDDGWQINTKIRSYCAYTRNVCTFSFRKRDDSKSWFLVPRSTIVDLASVDEEPLADVQETDIFDIGGTLYQMWDDREGRYPHLEALSGDVKDQ